MSDEQETKPMHWVKLTLLGWLIHVCIAGGLVSRVATVGPLQLHRYQEYNLRLPAATQLLADATRGFAGIDPWVFGALAVLDLQVLAILARWERPLWGWWFWGVVVVLLLGWPLVEFLLFLPEWKLREALAR